MPAAPCGQGVVKVRLVKGRLAALCEPALIKCARLTWVELTNSSALPEYSIYGLDRGTNGQTSVYSVPFAGQVRRVSILSLTLEGTKMNRAVSGSEGAHTSAQTILKQGRDISVL